MGRVRAQVMELSQSTRDDIDYLRSKVSLDEQKK